MHGTSRLLQKNIRFYSDDSVSAKIFIEFLALIIRSKFYDYLHEEMERLDTRSNYMTVPATIRELEKIELVCMPDGDYRLDHALTATQKVIPNVFGIDTKYVKHAVAQTD